MRVDLKGEGWSTILCCRLPIFEGSDAGLDQILQTIQLTKKSEFEFWVIAGEADD